MDFVSFINCPVKSTQKNEDHHSQGRLKKLFQTNSPPIFIDYLWCCADLHDMLFQDSLWQTFMVSDLAI